MDSRCRITRRTRTGSVGGVTVRFVLLSMLGWTLAVAHVSHAAVAAFQPDTLYGSRQRHPILVHHAQIGVVLPRRADSLTVFSLETSFDLSSPKRYPEGVTVFSTPDTMPRDSLVSRIRRIRGKTGAAVGAVGLVVSRTPTSEPMLVTDDFVVQYKPTASRAAIDSLAGRFGLIRTRTNPFRASMLQYRLPDTTSFDAISICSTLRRSRLVDYAVPNLLHVVHSLSSPTDEPLYSREWHLENTGVAGGTPDADIDAAGAWTITQGQPSVVIAVIDGGFDLTQKDLVDNLWTNPYEIACNGKDEDDKGETKYIDDVHGWDFFDCFYGCGSAVAGTPCYECDFDPSTGGDCAAHVDSRRCGDLEFTCYDPISLDFHGTAVAGIAAARGDNGIGVTGVAPLSQLMLIRRSLDAASLAESFDYAANKGAWVINCSWNLSADQVVDGPLETAIRNAAENGRGGKGCVIIFAMTNAENNDCDASTTNDDIYDIKRTDGRDAVIAVSGSNNYDEKVKATGFGDCTDLLAPTHGGSLFIATTDHSGNRGYNDLDVSSLAEPCPTPAGVDRESADQDFTYCFTGTSAAAPMVSGIAALVLAANPDLTSSDVQRLLQDTADKIEDGTGTSPANYDAVTGYSVGAAGVPTHGWGRANAYEAVRIAAAAGPLATGGVDMFLRDHSLDWGNTEQPSYRLPGPVPGYRGYWECYDIKIDAPPDWQTPPTTSAEFDALTDEEPQPGQTNRIYVRLRNRGPVAAAVTVKLHWAYCATVLPPLPSDFWSRFPADPTVISEWHPIGQATMGSLAYSGASSTRAPESDASQIAMIDFPVPALDPSLPTHLCLFAVLQSDTDPPAPMRKLAAGLTLDTNDFTVDYLTPRDNNIGQRNLILASVDTGKGYAERFYVRNTTGENGTFCLKMPHGLGWTLQATPKKFRKAFTLQAGESALVTIKGKPGAKTKPATFEITQHKGKTTDAWPVGGITVRYQVR